MPFGFRLSFDTVFRSNDTDPSVSAGPKRHILALQDTRHRQLPNAQLADKRRYIKEQGQRSRHHVDIRDAVVSMKSERTRMLDQESLDVLIRWTHYLEMEQIAWDRVPSDHASVQEKEDCFLSGELISRAEFSTEEDLSQTLTPEGGSVMNATRAAETLPGLSFEQNAKSDLVAAGLSQEATELTTTAPHSRSKKTLVESIYEWFGRVESKDASECETEGTWRAGDGN